MDSKAFSRRHFVRLAALGAGGTLLAACGATATPEVVKEVVTQVVEKEVTKEVEKEVTVEVTQVVEKVVTATAVAAQPIELVIWDPIFDPQQVLLQNLTAKYTEMHPEVTFKYESIQYDEVHKKVTIAMAGGGGPDAFNVPSYTWARFIENNTAVEVDPLAFGLTSMAELEARYVPDLLEAFKVDGKLTVIPTYVGSYLLLYNPVQWPNGYAPTWDELVAASKELNKFEGDQQTAVTIRMSVDNPEHIHADLGPFVWEKGGDFLTADRTQCRLTDPAVIEGFAQMRRLVDEKAWVPDFPYSDDGLFSGQIASAVGGDWGFGELDALAAELSVPKAELSGWPVYAVGDETQNYLQPWAWLVNANSKNPAQTWSVIGYFMNLENAERWMVETSQYTGVLASWAQEIEQSDPRMKVSWEQLSHANIGLISSKYDEVMEPIVQAAQAIMLTGANIEETLAAACAAVDGILAG
ncbi:MAG: ABC transporter substrate-binding protein [Anaerolineae bacterium]